MESAKLHLSTAAQSVFNEAGKGIAQKISSVLTPKTGAEVVEQSGSGLEPAALVAPSLSARRQRYQRRPTLQHPRRRLLRTSGRGRHKRTATRLKRIPACDFPDTF
ncbi:hypothetical protein RvY_18739 [Ramazzottius varieornatus]|uniref:Uncharacterized protein n=1 Tax=Ramazzottius varieornatus TaxID=947166 RepID=A0A1D1W6W6_RAMVA|nr:hypothetical protein RvY_18739 [Ramazzottius varieornatus]